MQNTQMILATLDARIFLSLIMQPKIAKSKRTHASSDGQVGRCDISSRAIVQFDNHFAVEVAC